MPGRAVDAARRRREPASSNAQLQEDKRQHALVLRDTNGYDVQLGFQLLGLFAGPILDLPAGDLPDRDIVRTIRERVPDAPVLATVSSTLLSTLATVGLPDTVRRGPDGFHDSERTNACDRFTGR